MRRWRFSAAAPMAGDLRVFRRVPLMKKVIVNDLMRDGVRHAPGRSVVRGARDSGRMGMIRELTEAAFREMFFGLPQDVAPEAWA